VAGIRQRQTAGKEKVVRAVLYDKMNSWYAFWCLEPISLNTHRCVSNPHSIRSSLNKLKSAEVRRVAGVNYTNTWSPRRQAATDRCFEQRFGRPPAKPGGRWCRRCMRTQPQRRDNSFEIAPSSCIILCEFSSGSKPLINGMRTCLQRVG
jgi:hypothetical protein